MAELSILFPADTPITYKTISETTFHDMGLDKICKDVSSKLQEQKMIIRVMSNLVADPAVSAYRCEVFEDIYAHPQMREELLTLFDKINFIKDFGGFKKDYDEAVNIWDLMHRLDEINDYIQCIESIYTCLKNSNVKSRGLCALRDYINGIFLNDGFEALKQDIAAIKVETSNIKSVTIGINLNDRYEATSFGLVSVNAKQFTKSGMLSHFTSKLSQKNSIQETTDWNENYKYEPVTGSSGPSREGIDRFALSAAMAGGTNPMAMAMMAMVPKADATESIMRTMEEAANHVLGVTAKKLRDTLSRHASVSLYDISNLIPEFIYYVRWAEYIEKLQKKGYSFCAPTVITDSSLSMDAKGVYNLKLVDAVANPSDIITNDLDFSNEHLAYILTGANRGGKTTITQTIGQLYLLAQGGIYVPGTSFAFLPVDGIYTHFPADEDKTLDFGRLGEECKRFKELYADATKDSLLLLNETFSTTSFEEGYFIARDSVKAILKKGCRTIYNTHMHKLAYDIDEINAVSDSYKAVSLIVESKEGNRSYKVSIAPPEGMSYAKDIAEKYGVTFEMLTQ